MPLILFMVGFAVGTFGTMVGAGGGFLVVPLLHLVFGFPPLQAVVTSLAMVFMNASSGSLAYARQKRIDYHSGILFGAATLPDVRRPVVVPGGETAFAPVSAAGEDTAGRPPRSLLGGRRQVTLADVTGQVFIYSYNLLPGIILGTLVGFVSFVLGIGGGIIHV